MSTDTAQGTAPALLTADEFAKLPDTGRPRELVHGEVVERSFHGARHGEVCTTAGCILGGFVDEHRLGHVVIGSGVITQRNPDTVRGPDVWFISYGKMPAGPLPDAYLDLLPDLIVEVFEPSDRWAATLGRAVEYRDAGVPVVCVLESQHQIATVCRPESHPVTLCGDDELIFPDVLPGFSVPVRTFFE